MGSWLAISGANTVLIAQALNHKNLGSTQIYARLHLDAVRDAMEKSTGEMFKAAGVAPLRGDGDMARRMSQLGPAFGDADDDELVEEKEAARICQLSLSKMQRLRRENEGPPYWKLGFQVLYPRRLLIAWMHGRTGAVDTSG